MSESDVIRMVNQIALFFAPYPESDAIDGIHDHMMKFWPPAMRRELASVIQRSPGPPAELHPLALLAAQRLSVAPPA
ncbi:MAG TPA: formate dehydrogenase subunit delta [Gemmatimonas sp.]|uniref:formate dehydrogenase subunit delta n=1 Tax=Gemmatimonas sp. TaxID=1962908 RepID=UPI002EDA2233